MTSTRFSALLPLIITVALLAGGAWLCYQIYLSFTQIRHSASESMSRKNVVFSRDGVRVGVKDTSNEKLVDATQSYVVKAWNLSRPHEDEELKKRQR